MDKDTPQGLIALCKEFFGFKPGQTLMEFRDEFKALSPEDKDDLRKSFEAAGFKVKE
jgi:hypothetical protein